MTAQGLYTFEARNDLYGKWMVDSNGVTLEQRLKDSQNSLNTADSARRYLENEARNWDDGDRGCITIPGHVFNVVKRNGRLECFEAQVPGYDSTKFQEANVDLLNKVLEIAIENNKKYNGWTDVAIARMDDLEFTPDAFAENGAGAFSDDAELDRQMADFLPEVKDSGIDIFGNNRKNVNAVFGGESASTGGSGQLAEVKQACDEIDRLSNKIATELQQFNAKFTNCGQHIQQAIGGSARHVDQQFLAHLQQASHQVVTVSQHLQQVGKGTKQYGEQL